MERLSVEEGIALAANALIAAGTHPRIAAQVADALIAAQVDGQGGHGLIRLSEYITDLRAGRIDGEAEPVMTRPAPGYVAIDAQNGFAYPALELAVDAVSEAAGAQGIAFAAIRNSYHAGQCGRWVEKLATRGCIGMMFTNARASMAPHGGARPMFGTNPIAFAVARREGAPIIVDLSLSTVARGKVLAAKREGRAIPEGWAVDAKGNPTTDPEEALNGSLLPLGGAKGTALAIMVEIFAASLTGANSSLAIEEKFGESGAPVGMGHSLLAIDIRASVGEDFFDRVEALALAIEAEEGVRLPGATRTALREDAQANGLSISPQMLRDLKEISA